MPYLTNAEEKKLKHVKTTNDEGFLAMKNFGPQKAREASLLGTGGSKFNAVPAATGRSRQDRSRSTWGLVSSSIGSISNLVSRHLA